MAHWITALVGSPTPLTAFAAEHGFEPPVPLEGDLVLLRLDDSKDFLAPHKAPESGEWEDQAGLEYLSEALIGMLATLSLQGALVYLETRYWSAGGQGAAAFADGRLLNPPEWAEEAINGALQAIGVVARPPLDAFDTIGLGDHG